MWNTGDWQVFLYPNLAQVYILYNTNDISTEKLLRPI